MTSSDHLWCFIFRLNRRHETCFYHLRGRTHTKAGKSQIFDPVALLQCCNSSSVQRGKIMLWLCAHLRKLNQFKRRQLHKCWSGVLLMCKSGSFTLIRSSAVYQNRSLNWCRLHAQLTCRSVQSFLYFQWVCTTYEEALLVEEFYFVLVTSN